MLTTTNRQFAKALRPLRRSTPRSHVLGVAVALVFLSSCKTDEISLTNEQRYFAATSNQENRVRSYADRYQRASVKAESFEKCAVEAEEKLAGIVQELQQARVQRDAQAAELAGLNAEVAKLQQDIAAAKTALDAGRGELAKVQTESTEVQKSLTDIEQQKVDLLGRLDEARQKNEKCAERVKALMEEIAAE